MFGTCFFKIFYSERFRNSLSIYVKVKIIDFNF